MNQYFHYNPITGLNYFSGEGDLIIDISVIPSDFSNQEFIQRWLYHARRMGISMIDVGVDKVPIESVPQVITNID